MPKVKKSPKTRTTNKKVKTAVVEKTLPKQYRVKCYYTVSPIEWNDPRKDDFLADITYTESTNKVEITYLASHGKGGYINRLVNSDYVGAGYTINDSNGKPTLGIDPANSKSWIENLYRGNLGNRIYATKPAIVYET